MVMSDAIIMAGAEREILPSPALLRMISSLSIISLLYVKMTVANKAIGKMISSSDGISSDDR